MAKDDYFRIQYIILRLLYEYKKQCQPVDIKELSPEALGKSKEGYRDDILGEMLQEGYIKGIGYDEYIAGPIITDLENIKITPKGIEYLKNNSNLKKVADVIGSAVEAYLTKLF